MSEREIHPRIKVRMEAVEKYRDAKVLDRQVRVYCLLNKAARKLKELEAIQAIEVPGEAQFVLSRGARVIRGQALRGDQDQIELMAVYDDLERLSNIITSALESGSTS